VCQALLTRYCRSGTKKDLHATNIPDTLEDLLVGGSCAAIYEKQLKMQTHGKKWMVGPFLGVPFLGPPKNLTLVELLLQKGTHNRSDLVPPGCILRIAFDMHKSNLFWAQTLGMTPKAFFVGEEVTATGAKVTA
jgi:hypothetical protein